MIQPANDPVLRPGAIRRIGESHQRDETDLNDAKDHYPADLLLEIFLIEPVCKGMYNKEQNERVDEPEMVLDGPHRQLTHEPHNREWLLLPANLQPVEEQRVDQIRNYQLGKLVCIEPQNLSRLNDINRETEKREHEKHRHREADGAVEGDLQ